MLLRTLPLSQLKPAPYNPRIPLQPGSPPWIRLERSLREFDLVQPIVWNERTGHVVAGHQRLEILRHQGVTQTEVAVVSLPLEREKALNVTLNNASVASDWDTDKLISLVAELDDLPDFDATLTGFDEGDIRDLILEPGPLLPDPLPPESPQAPVVRIQFELPPERWESLRPNLDRFLATHSLTPHITLPQ